jgi:ATP-dependent DNA ligase
MKFDKLFKRNKNNSIIQWSINVINNSTHSVINVEYGGKDSKNITYSTIIKEGKNLGKKNETTHYEQAIKEAESKWKSKQERENYKTFLEDIDSGVSPMLAHPYEKHFNKITFPVYVQPKLDGYRMLFYDKKCFTRQSKEYSILYGTKLYEELCTISHSLDGELFIEDGEFEKLGILRKKALKTEEDKNLLDKIQYHIYDIVDMKKVYNDRHETLLDIFSKKYKYIKYVPTYSANDKSDINKFHEKFINEKYEGSIIRNYNGMYIKGRSYDLLKYKDFMDEEYKIVDFTYETEGLSKENIKTIIWCCVNENGEKFNVKPKGTVDERRKIYIECLQNFDSLYKNKMLWVKFFEKTQYNIPRFPSTKTDKVSTYIRNELL